MNAKPAAPDRSSPPAVSARRLLQLIRTCQETAETIATNDHATMNEIEQALAVAEMAAQRLLTTLLPDSGADEIDIDDF